MNTREITFTCSRCGQELAAEEKLMGIALNCPSCDQALTVPHDVGVMPDPGPFAPVTAMQPATLDACEQFDAAFHPLAPRILFASKIQKRVNELLQHHEGIKVAVQVIRCTKTRGSLMRDSEGVLVVTTHQLLYVGRAIIKESIAQFELDQIDSIQVETGMMASTFTIAAGQATLVLKVKKSMAQGLQELITRAMRDYQQHRMHASARPSDELEAFASLRDRGILSADEYGRAKSLVLGPLQTKADEIAAMISNLHRLFDKGVLSEGEFNQKKWDVLSRP